MTRMGMDVTAVEQAARNITAQADRLNQLSGQIGRSVTQLNNLWYGTDSQHLVHTRWPQNRAALASAETVLRSMARSLRTHATEQRRASGAGVGVTPSAVAEALKGALGTVGGFVGAMGATSLGGMVSSFADAYGDGLSRLWDLNPHATLDRSGLRASAGVSASAGAEYGLRAGDSWSRDFGPLSTEAGFDAFVGARADAKAGIDIGTEGIKAKAGVSTFVGTEVSGNASAELGGVKGSVNAGFRAGLGAEASGHFSASMDEVSIGLKLGVTFGIGGYFEPKITFSPKKIADTLKVKWPPW